MNTRPTLALGTLLALALCARAAEPANVTPEAFREPPTQARAMVYWDWITGNINRAAITRDLEHMKRVGIGGGLLFDVPPLNSANGYAACPPDGPVDFMSGEWLDLVNFAAEESHRLGLDFGVVLCCAWNTGGPWIKPKDNNQLTASSLTRITGPHKAPLLLPPPSDDPDYQDVAVVAWPTSDKESRLMTENPPQIRVNGKPGNEHQFRALLDGNRETLVSVPTPKKNAPTVIEFTFPKPVTVDRLYIQEEPRFGIKAGRLEADVDGAPRKLGEFETTGFSPVEVSFDPVTATTFRLVATSGQRLAETGKSMRLYEAALMEPGKAVSSAPEIRNWTLKTSSLTALGRKRDERQLPADHLEPTPDTAGMPGLNPKSVVALTGKLGADGNLAWEVPAGNWTILRFGMVPSHSGTYNFKRRKGNENALESDKMSADATRVHYKAMAGAIFDRLSPEGRKGLDYFEVDSWEGEENLWTKEFLEEFNKLRGYDLVPYLPVFDGKMVVNGTTSDRVLWDYRRTIGDLHIKNHFKKLADLCHEDGVKLCAESGHGFQANMDAIGSLAQVDYPAGEFWFGGRGAGRYDVRNSVKDASSTVNVYGKPYGLFEAFTTGQFQSFWPAPLDLKKIGDFALAEGVSRMFIHGMWLDPVVGNKPPGISWSAGIHVGPSITWMPDGRAFFDYLARCQYLLQAGVVDKDALYFYGDGFPNIAPKRDELPLALPEGRDYDATDARAIRDLLSAKDGKLTLPHGATYRVLVLPPLDTMLPETLTAIHRLVQDGAIVAGPKPLRSPSLSGQPQADQTVRQLADELWGEKPGASGSKQTGRGTVHWGTDLQAVFAAHRIPPQTEVAAANGADIKHIHRRTPDGREFYFLTNQCNQSARPEILFRSSANPAFLWRPDTGDIFRLDGAAAGNGTTRLKVPLDPWGSAFVVFDPLPDAAAHAQPLPPETPAAETIALAGPWRVAFEKDRGAPEEAAFEKLQSWTSNPRPGIKYFSGYGTYRKDFVLPESQISNLKSQILLDLGAVGDVAHVKVNGHDFGTLWKPPYRADITSAVKAGNNQLEVAVVNTWVNRLMGDDAFPKEKPVANIMVRNSILATALDKHPSGLLGPVTLEFLQSQPDRIPNP